MPIDRFLLIYYFITGTLIMWLKSRKQSFFARGMSMIFIRLVSVKIIPLGKCPRSCGGQRPEQVVKTAIVGSSEAYKQGYERIFGNRVRTNPRHN